MSTPNIQEETRKLVDLQEIDSQIYGLRKEKEANPALLETLQKNFEAKKANLKLLEEKRQKMILTQKQKEGDLASKEEGIKKTQSQLGQLKTNKEYQAKLAEIEGLKADKSIIEEEILTLMDEIEAAKDPIETEKKNVTQEEKVFNEEKNKILARARDIDAALQQLGGKRDILAATVDKKILERYEHILNGRGGVAIVKVNANSCQGCFMHVPHQVVNEIKMHDRLITCEICSRILYLDEDVAS